MAIHWRAVTKSLRGTLGYINIYQDFLKNKQCVWHIIYTGKNGKFLQSQLICWRIINGSEQTFMFNCEIGPDFLLMVLSSKRIIGDSAKSRSFFFACTNIGFFMVRYLFYIPLFYYCYNRQIFGCACPYPTTTRTPGTRPGLSPLFSQVRRLIRLPL